MSLCSFEKYFGEYIDGLLTESNELDFVKHIGKCPTCPDRLDLYYTTHRVLKNVKRPDPDNELSQRYENQLNCLFGSPPLIKRWYYFFEDFIHRILSVPVIRWRYAIISIVLIAGIFIGRFLLNPAEPESTIEADIPYLWDQPVSSAEIEYINYYLQASEIILLEIENINPEDADLLISNETAQKLLIKTFMVHESALRLNSPQLLHFLSKMELILYELANAEKDDSDELIASIRMVIADSDLLGETRRLQKFIEDTKKG
jgi:hypothetical protein